jgi:hypothetical protein
VDGECSVAEPHQFYVDPDAFKDTDAAFHFDADPVGDLLGSYLDADSNPH